MTGTVHFIGAGPGDPDLITVKGADLLARAGTVIYAGSLVSPAHLERAPKNARILDSSGMNLPEIVQAMADAVKDGDDCVRLHTGDPALFGAIGEQMQELDALGIGYTVVPGVTAAFAAAAAMNAELTLPDVSQTLVLTRTTGRTPMPESESIANLARIGGTLCFYLSAAKTGELARELIDAGRAPDTPTALCEKVSWKDERIITGTLADIGDKAAKADITRHALIIVGDVIARNVKAYSKLYDKDFGHGYRP